MAIQHRDITDPNLHEPKGASSAGTGTVYISNGAGSGAWGNLPPSSLEGLGSAGVDDNLKIVSDGSGGLQYKKDSAYGLMEIINNSANFAVTAAADSTLTDNSDYAPVEGTGAPWASGLTQDVTYSSATLTADSTGVYKIVASGVLHGIPSATTRIGIKAIISDTVFTDRKSEILSGTANFGSFYFEDIVSLNAGDSVQLGIASDESGNVIIDSASFSITLLGS